MGCHRLKERALPEYKTRSWAKAVTPSANLYFVRQFPELLFSFLTLIESESSEQVSRKIVAEEPNKGLQTCSAL